MSKVYTVTHKELVHRLQSKTGWTRLVCGPAGVFYADNVPQKVTCLLCVQLR